MKYLSLLLLMLASLFAGAEKIPYRVEGLLKGSITGKYAYLQVHANAATQKSSFVQTTVTNNQFVFTGVTETTGSGFRTGRVFITDKPGLTSKDIVALQKSTNYDNRNFILEKLVKIVIASKMKEAEVIGGFENELNTQLENINIGQMTQSENIRVEYNNLVKQAGNDKALIEKLRAEEWQQIWLSQEESMQKRIAIVKQHPNNPQCLRALHMSSYLNESMSGKYQASLEEVWQSLSPASKASYTGKQIRINLDKAKAKLRLGAGDPLPEHTFTYENNGSVSMSSFKGKYLFLDFWTSWCTPCRGEHYYMKQAYQKFKDKGFTILQVSLDDRKDKWLKALEQDKLPWQNLRNATGWDKELEKIFNFTGVPANFLVAPDGKIIARNLRGEQLEKKLAELLR